MQRALVAYGTNAGSTAAVATIIGEELGAGGMPVDVRGIRDIHDIGQYGAVVVGGPMIFGAWHADAVGFVVRRQTELRRKPIAFFVTALHLTRTSDTHVGSAAVYYDPALATPPRRSGRLSFTERHATPDRYLAPVLKKARLVDPVSVAFLGGKMDYAALTPGKRLFARFVIRKEGDFRNWPAVRAWGADMRRLLLSGPSSELSDSVYAQAPAAEEP